MFICSWRLQVIYSYEAVREHMIFIILVIVFNELSAVLALLFRCCVYLLFFMPLHWCVWASYRTKRKNKCMIANETTLHKRPNDTEIKNYRSTIRVNSIPQSAIKRLKVTNVKKKNQTRKLMTWFMYKIMNEKQVWYPAKNENHWLTDVQGSDLWPTQTECGGVWLCFFEHKFNPATFWSAC